MNIYILGVVEFVRKFPRDARRDDVVSGRTVLFGGFSTSPSLRGHSQPPFPGGGGLFSINMHYAEADKRSERPAVPL